MRLAQEISALTRSVDDERSVHEQQLKERIARLESEATERERELDSYVGRLEESQDRAVEAEQNATGAEKELYHAQGQAELERLQAIADKM